MAESEENFEVEEIVNHRYRKGKIQYLIRWKNYGAEDDTWEPHENLDCPEKISAYDKQVKINKIFKLSEPPRCLEKILQPTSFQMSPTFDHKYES